MKKYSLYAVGEIILVVIGILIALQINNWNESRKEQQQAIKYLSEIKENLIVDTTMIREIQKLNEKKHKAITNSIQLFEKGLGGSAEIRQFESFMNNLARVDVFVSNRTAFDNMIASGNISFISNKELRNSLSGYYSLSNYESGTPERLKVITRRFVDSLNPKLVSKEMIQEYFKKDIDIQSRSDIQINKDVQVISDLFLMDMITKGYIQELNIKKMNITLLIANIDTKIQE